MERRCFCKREKMGKKQELRTKAVIEEEDNLELINKKISKLKDEFSRHTYNHIGHLYSILSEIVKLKKYSIPHYTQRSLEWEKGLKITSMQIRYIFSYQYICPYTEKKVKENLINDATVCHFLSVSKLLRESRWQIKLVDKIINEDIKIGEISELTIDELKLFLLGKLKIRKDDKYLLSSTKTLRSILLRLKEREKIMETSPYSENLFNAIKNLNDFINKMEVKNG